MRFDRFWDDILKIPREQMFTDHDLRADMGFGVKHIADEGFWLHKFDENKDELIDKQKFQQMWSDRIPTELKYTGEDCQNLFRNGVESIIEYYIFKWLIDRIRPNSID